MHSQFGKFSGSIPDPWTFGFRGQNQVRIRRIQDHSTESFQDQISNVTWDQRKDQFGSLIKWSCDPHVMRDQFSDQGLDQIEKSDEHGSVV